METCPLPHPEQSRLSTNFINKPSISCVYLEKKQRKSRKSKVIKTGNEGIWGQGTFNRKKTKRKRQPAMSRGGKFVISKFQRGQGWGFQGIRVDYKMSYMEYYILSVKTNAGGIIKTRIKLFSNIHFSCKNKIKINLTTIFHRIR